MSDSRSASTPEDLALSVGEVALSSYSPAALTHLRQPVPSDLPPHLDASVFTFHDAFEDLLAVSQGRPLSDIGSRYQQSRMLRQMYPHGEPTWLWISRLQSQGLIGTPRGSSILRASQAGWDELQRGLEEGADALWRSIREDPKNREAAAQVGQVFRELREQFGGSGETSSSRSLESKNKNGEPDDFDELYSAIKSAYANGQGAWDAFKRTMNEDAPRRMDEFERQMEDKFKEKQSHDVTEKTASKNEKETRSEWVDVFGYKHTTIKRKTYDENGKEIDSSTFITIAPAEKKPSDAIENSDGNTSDKKKTGWFW
ncbi:uncharacterized protein LMH87_008231 [Akanthomyces muscarius]|uniref:Uncharacterized protein n=1 Tax=Akanthomyces muscarius TaxID=2231603 RepID=A0A9W8QL95_AKAMU|nr:uncharacterized protein LMH87_008231 [Akanthomyces muscarius]KAJ4159325.1 hypothetical protein LMH87_008231 [Akanthomyces muscarius]